MGNQKRRTQDTRDKKGVQDPKERRCKSSPHPTQVDDYCTSVCAFLNAASAPNEADRADDRLLSASIPHPSHNPRIPSLHVDVLLDTGVWSADYMTAASVASVGGH